MNHYTYIALNLAFLVVAMLIIIPLRLRQDWGKITKIGGLLLISMIVFDTYLTALPVVRYNSEYILGIRLGTIPVEDFCYLAAVLILAPALYKYFSKHKGDS